MASPKSLLFHLHKHWEVVEVLARASRELPSFSEEQILAAVGKASSESDLDERAGILRALSNTEILQRLPRSSELQLNPLVLEFVRGLTREHELGLSSVLKARVEALRDATQELNDGVEHDNTDQLRAAAARLSELLRQISQQLDQDRHAILELAEQAKSGDSGMPLARRYRRVLDAYDQYVEPMNQMMDTGASGTFYRYLESAEQSLDHAAWQLNVQGALYSHRLQLRQVAYQAKELRRTGRVVAQQCADTLLPLREELRQNNTLSSAISALLGEVRKKGLRRSLPARKDSLNLPVWRAERPRRISVGDDVLEVMAEALHFSPQVQTFPEELEPEQSHIADWVDEQLLREHLSESLPVEHLFDWLTQHYGDLPDAVLLRLYHDLARNTDWQCEQASYSSTTDLQKVRVHHYPHMLSSL
jgi:hypothetical protein